jgi:hypothetical protein
MMQQGDAIHPLDENTALIKRNLRRQWAKREPDVRCSSFSWRDQRKGKGYRQSGWLVDWRDETGKRHRKKFRDPKEAKCFQSQKQAEALNISRAVRYVHTRLTDTQIDQAEAALTRLGERYTFSQVVDFFFAHYQETSFKGSLSEAALAFRGAMEGIVRDRTLLQLKSTLAQFERFTENPSLCEITTLEIERFLKSLRGRDGISPAAPKSWNNFRADLCLFFKWCIQKPRRWLALNPAADVARLRVERGHIEVLSLERARMLMDYVAGFKAGKYIWYFGLALFAGIRPAGELTKLSRHRELVDFRNRVIRISGAISKTGRSRQIKLRPNLYEWLSRYPPEILPVNSSYELGEIRQRFRLSRDVLRHTFCSAHVMAFGSFAEAALESGNSESIIRNHYLNVMPKEEAEAFWAITPTDTLEGKVVRLA